MEVVKLLLGWGADVDVLNRADKTAEEVALENGKADVSSFLAEYKADVHVRNTLDVARHDAHEDGQDEETISLHTASSEGKVDVVKTLLDQDADINSRNASYNTPLHIAAFNGNIEVTRLLIERGAEVDSRNYVGWTPLLKASQAGHVEISRMLIDRGANVNARKYDYWTPIHFSAYNGYPELVELLLEHQEISVDLVSHRETISTSGSHYQRCELRECLAMPHDATPN